MKQSALSTQIGGSHYLTLKIQPDYFCVVNNLNGVYMNFLKYVIRVKTNKLEDLKKARHAVETLKELKHHFHPIKTNWSITPRVFVELNNIESDIAEIIYNTMRGNFNESIKLLSTLICKAEIYHDYASQN